MTHLELSGCRIPDRGGYEIAKALQAGNLKLKFLNLSHNEIGNKSGVAFGSALERNHTLLHLNLSWNAIKESGAEALAKGLKSNTALQEFNLSWNGIETQGVMHFGEMLQDNLGLKFLDLSSTRVGPDACIVLAEGIRVYVHLIKSWSSALFVE